ncbi:MAG: hypothetical protein JSR82_22220, partial [Verrucomicrobia bacterium]|nr:hypothetical protein [Verrucomicrobiota bacterium]
MLLRSLRRLVPLALTSFLATLLPAASATLTAEQARADIETLLRALQEAHPGLYRHTTQELLDRRFAALREQIAGPLEPREFVRLIAQMLAEVRCGHTRLELDAATRAALGAAAKFPLRVQLEEGRLIVLGNDSAEDRQIVPGSEVLEIDGRPTAEVVREIFARLPTDGFADSLKAAQLRRSFAHQYWLHVAPSARFAVQVRLPTGTVLEAELAGVTDAARAALANPVNDALRGQIERLEGARENVSLRFLAQPTVAHLRVRSFATGPEYAAQLAAAFREITEKKAEAVILDLRRNGGGVDLSGALLVSHFVDRPFRYFARIEQTVPVPSFATWKPASVEQARANVVPDPSGRGYLVTPAAHPGLAEQAPSAPAFLGRLIVLLDGGTFSTAADVCAALQQVRPTQFVGEESGGGRRGNTSGLNADIILPHSQLRVRIPMWGYWNAVPESPEPSRGVRPDVTVESRVADLLQGIDAPLETALRLAKGAEEQRSR